MLVWGGHPVPAQGVCLVRAEPPRRVSAEVFRPGQLPLWGSPSDVTTELPGATLRLKFKHFLCF